MAALIRPHTRRKGMCRILLFAALLPLLLFVLMFCAAANSVAAVHRRGYDRISKHMGPQPKAMVVELPRKGRSGVSVLAAASTENNGWAPIRIKFFDEDLRNESRYCTKVGDERVLFFDSKVHTCKESDVLTEKKKAILVNQLLPGAIKLHSDRLLVQPVTGRIIVPKFTDDVCSHFTIPNSHHTEGVEGTDLVLYVAAGPDDVEGIDMQATYCFLDTKTERPLVGILHINPFFITLSNRMVRTAAREIGHALGFNYDIISSKRAARLLIDRSIRGKPKVYVLTGRKTIEKAREHYNCTNITAVELEDEDIGVNIGSCWKMRNAKDELMSPVIGAGYYTSLTMAVFEDLGYYRANWSMAETMGWGKNAGCDFLQEKCVTNSKSNFPDMFCDDLKTSDNYYTCVSDRSGLGDCNNMIHKNLIPEHFQYFDSPLVGGPTEFTDYCPYVSPDSKGDRCDDKSKAILGSRFGTNSRCLKGDELQYDDISIGDVCADIKCGNGTVSVRYYGNDTWIDCPYGKAITPRGGFSKGTIVCPKYHEVCLEVGAGKTPVDPSPPIVPPASGVETPEERKIEMAQTVVIHSRRLWEKILKNSEDIAQTVSYIESLFVKLFGSILIAKNNVELLKDMLLHLELLTKLNELIAAMKDAREMATAAKNAEAVAPKDPKKRNFSREIEKTEERVLNANVNE